MNDLRLIYYNAYGGGGGEMTVHLDKFFPCGAGRFKELLRVVRISNNPQEAIRILRDYFERRIPELDAEQASATALHYAKRQRETEEKRRLQEGKYENGVMIPKGELKQLKTKIIGIRGDYRRALSDAKKATKGVGQLNKLLALLEKER